MTKDELKPIDVSKYRVTETGQVLKMTKDELAKKADTNHALISQLSELEAENAELKEDIRNKKLAIQNRNGRIKELEEKITVLLSCKNCPDNKGGYICEKEYEDKCLTQKIQYIKELQEEIAELKAFRQDCVKLTEDNVVMAMQRAEMARKLTKAKELLNEFMRISKASDEDFEHDYSELIAEAEQFLKEVEK